MIIDTWRSTGHAQSVAEFLEKLSHVVSQLQRWGWTSFSLARMELCYLRGRMEELHSVPTRLEPDVEEKEFEARMVELCLREEIMWHQRSHVQWLIKGTVTQSFFTEG